MCVCARARAFGENSILRPPSAILYHNAWDIGYLPPQAIVIVCLLSFSLITSDRALSIPCVTDHTSDTNKDAPEGEPRCRLSSTCLCQSFRRASVRDSPGSLFWIAVYASRTEALRKLALPGDLVVWTTLPGFLGARWWGTDGLLGLTWKGIPEEWKGSTGKWASLCRSRATGHASRLPSSLRWRLLRAL